MTSQMNDSFGRSTKKVRRQQMDPSNLDDLIVGENGMQVDNSKEQKMSWNDKLVGNTSHGKSQIREEFRLLVKTVDRIPSFTFSKEVHKHIERDMAKTMIIKLMGRMIAFHMLLGKIQSLWQLKNLIQLMDLEKHYYLMKFQDDEDYATTLMGGLWIIFEQYLVMQPWSP
ncbi:hypothetical protein J1N35_044126 [Gossypium stocksii]|uniref:DUF4283 domain-containing protein n=1 Tax=Gossypium stocksii TaxID=47602 RepID=A0A9D3U8L4_9ROSI|nr:hypothetical protein J1N35_044126 [Gossypium stocksii]